ncbi:hypothetical protein [Vibrio viridaestus]|uniref:DUF2946 domain-containing protein n=1 Tax=Vibrio viridaestus TaxID=2487322 RepID=A0A3N9TF01_9VIBR|nr:hypothetical protein [Vibrio viridaestus]RQW62610.1 hypothetical protein EES38_12860 [Vibrio viridaestus]
MFYKNLKNKNLLIAVILGILFFSSSVLASYQHRIDLSPSTKTTTLNCENSICSGKQHMTCHMSCCSISALFAKTLVRDTNMSLELQSKDTPVFAYKFSDYSHIINPPTRPPIL